MSAKTKIPNRVSAELTAEAIAKIKSHIEGITEALPFLIGLTKAERKQLPKINKSNKLFVEDAIMVAQHNQSMLPTYITTEEMQRDFELYKTLADIALPLAQLAEKVSDTRMQAGSEAFQVALMTYKLVQFGAEAGMPGMDAAADLLGQRFASQGNNTEDDQAEEIDSEE